MSFSWDFPQNDHHAWSTKTIHFFKTVNLKVIHVWIVVYLTLESVIVDELARLYMFTLITVVALKSKHLTSISIGTITHF